ncbi:MAG TPA: hypothetical protein VK960_03780 [Acidimicrobiia bacterium]|nr:hypothetical protein [Acidimicrobiia bacterium]
MEARRIIPFVLLAVAAAVVFLWPTNHPDDSLALPETTTTTEPFVPGVYGSSWTILAGAPVAGRERMALAELDGDVFMFGGTVAGFTDPELPVEMFHQDAWIYDADPGYWQLAPPAPFAMCRLADPRAISGGEAAPIVLWGRVDAAEEGCVRAASFDPDVGWTALDPTFFDRLAPGDLVFWQPASEVPFDEWPALPTSGWGRLVAPATGLTYTLPGGVLGSLDAGSSAVVPTGRSLDASSTWTGEWLLTVEGGLMFGWEAAVDRWHWNLGGTPIGADGQDIAGTDLGIVLVNRRHEAAMIEDPVSTPWSVLPAIPLRAGGCNVEVVSVGGRPVARSCGGMAVYEPYSGGWVPFPPPIGIDGRLLATEDALYWFSTQVSRLEFLPGGVLAPSRLPIGLTEIDLPDGYQFSSSIGLVHTMDAERRVLSEIHGFEVTTPRGDTCSVLGAYQPTATGPEPEGIVTVDRPVLPALEALDYSQDGVARYVIETSPTDTVEIRCGRHDDALALVAALQWIKL